MNGKPPTPVLKTFLLCNEIYQDAMTKRLILIGPSSDVTASSYPTIARMGFFIVMTSTHGSYRFQFQLHGDADQVVWQQTMQPDYEAHDPLKIHQVSFRNMSVVVPRPGRYDLIILTNEEEIGRQPIYCHLQGQTSDSPRKTP